MRNKVALLLGALTLGVLVAVAPSAPPLAPEAEAAPGACITPKFDKLHTRETDLAYTWVNWANPHLPYPPVGGAKVRNAETIGYRWCPTKVNGKWIGPGRVKPLYTKYCHMHYNATGPFAGTNINPKQSPYFKEIKYDTDFFDDDEEHGWFGHTVRKIDENGSQVCSAWKKIPYEEREWLQVGDGGAGWTTAMNLYQDLQRVTSDYIRNSEGYGSEVAWFTPSSDVTFASFPNSSEPAFSSEPMPGANVGKIAGPLYYEPPVTFCSGTIEQASDGTWRCVMPAPCASGYYDPDGNCASVPPDCRRGTGWNIGNTGPPNTYIPCTLVSATCWAETGGNTGYPCMPTTGPMPKYAPLAPPTCATGVPGLPLCPTGNDGDNPPVPPCSGNGCPPPPITCGNHYQPSCPYPDGTAPTGSNGYCFDGMTPVYDPAYGKYICP